MTNENNNAIPEITEYNPVSGRWARARRRYLHDHRHMKYTSMFMSGKLEQHLKEVEEEAVHRRNVLMEQMAKAQGVTEELKAKDQMRWVGLMNNIKACAEEIIYSELIYV